MTLRAWQRGALALLTAFLVLQVPMRGGLALSEQVLKLLVGALLLLWLSRRPELALLVLVVFVPVQTMVLALLLSQAQLPVGMVRALGLTKELCVAALVVAAVERGSRRAFDLLDKIALVYLALVSFYLVLPLVVEGGFVPLPFGARALGWRANALFVVAFLAARRIPLSPGFRRRLVTAVVAVGLVGAGCALVEFLASDTWSRFLIRTVNLRFYRAAVLGDLRPPTDELLHTLVAGRDVVRVGSFTFSALVFGFMMMVPLAILLEHLAGTRRRLLVGAASALCGVVLLLTLTRSAILGALLLTLITLRLASARKRPGRIQVAIGLLLTGVLVAPFVGASALGDRFASTFQGDTSAASHQSQSLQAIEIIVAQPMGLGLGTAPGIGTRYEFRRTVTAESAYLQVGLELGLLTMIVFILLTIALLRQLRRRALSDAPDAGLASAMLAAGAGIALGGLFLHVWLGLATALTFWPVAGIALSHWTADQAAEDANADEPAEASAVQALP